MDLVAGYCPIRRDLEEWTWILTSRLAALTARLLKLTGGNRPAFLELMDECQTAHLEISESRSNLQEHRCEHGC